MVRNTKRRKADAGFGTTIARTAEAQRAILQTIIDNIPGAVSLFDGRKCLVACNRQMIDLLGFPASMFVDRMPTLEELARFNAERGEYGPGDPEEIVRQFMERADKREAHHFERMRPDGTVLDIRGAPLPDGGFVTIYTDITHLKQVHGELERNLFYLRSILDHLPQGISVFDDQLRLKCWNDAFCEVLQLPPDIVHQDVSFDDLIMVPARRGEYGPGDPAALVAERRALAMRFAAHRFERTRPNGRTHLVEGRPMLSNGQVTGFITSYTDITDRKESEQALVRQNAMLQALIDNMPGGVSVFDADLNLSLFNSEVRRLLDLPVEFIGRKPSFAEVIRFNAERGEYGAVDIDQKVAEMVELAKHPVPHRMERIRPDGTVVEIRGAPLPGGGFASIYIDVTYQKQVENELRRRNAVFQTLVDNIPGGVTLFDRDFRLVAHNQEYRRLLEFPDELFEGEPTLERFFRFNVARGEYGEVKDAEAHVLMMLERARLNQPHLFERTRPNGVVLEIRGLPLQDGGFVSIYTDVTERKTAAAAIERLAHRDALTGLANRYNLEARLDQVIADAHRHETKVALMFIDMDRFKTINDTLGHSVGDRFLVEIASRLSATTRDTDIVARLGGDEFVIVLSDIREVNQISLVAEKIVKTLSQPMMMGDEVLVSSASLGIAVFPDDADNRETLMRNADIAMYHAKGAGRGRFQIFDAQMSAAALARTRIEADLRHAVERGAFMLYFQPQISTSSGKVCGLEALIRWRRGDDFVSPDIFIPVAEESGLIEMIGAWVLREACLNLRAWDEAGLSVPGVAVNISARQLRSPTFIGMVRSIFHETGVDARRLEFEVTETAAMEDPQLTIENMRALRALGISLAIDDFGTGYSSLGYLKLLPINKLKIDRTFVMDIETDSNDAAICSATIGLAHSLGLEVVAEGVETAEQRTFLQALGCDVLQGYFFHRPMPEEEIRSLYRSGRAG